MENIQYVLKSPQGRVLLAFNNERDARCRILKGAKTRLIRVVTTEQDITERSMA
jgi:hypothetical protein